MNKKKMYRLSGKKGENKITNPEFASLDKIQYRLTKLYN